VFSYCNGHEQALEAKDKKKGTDLLKKLARKLRDKHIRCVQVFSYYRACSLTIERVLLL